MRARLYDRLAAMASVAFLLTLAAGTYYLAVWVTRAPGTTTQVRTNEPDMFVEGVSLVRVNAQGSPAFQMSAQRMRHFPIDGSSEFDAPRLISVDPSRPRVTVTAQRAIASQNGDETVMSGDVLLRREADGEQPALEVRTERLVVNARTEVASTDLAVEIRQGHARLTGVGMEFDNLSRELSLHSQVSGYWPPPPSPDQRS